MSAAKGREGARSAAGGSLARTTAIINRAAQQVRTSSESYSSVERAANRRLGEIERRVSDEVERAVIVAAERVARANGGTEADAKIAVLETLGQGGVRALVTSHVEPARRSIDRMVMQARRLKIPPDELGRDLSRLLGEGTGAGAGAMARKYGLPTSAVSDLYTIRTDLRRVAATAPMNTMRVASTRAQLRAGYDYARWTLSPYHRKRDACDDLAEAASEYGKGVYLLLAWPNAPHPHCGCYPEPVGEPIEL